MYQNDQIRLVNCILNVIDVIARLKLHLQMKFIVTMHSALCVYPH